MSDDPQLEDVREWYIAGRRTHNPFASDAALVERFDTWLAAHDREVAAQALRAAYDDLIAELLSVTEDYVSIAALSGIVDGLLARGGEGR